MRIWALATSRSDVGVEVETECAWKPPIGIHQGIETRRGDSRMKLRMLCTIVVAALSGCALPGNDIASDPTTAAASHSARPSQIPPNSASPSASVEPSVLPSGQYGPVWEMDPVTAFAEPASCENLAGLPTQEFGENVAWRISYPADWSAQEAYIGECMWFGPEPWDADLENPVPPEEVAIVISVLDGRVTPGSQEFEGGSVVREQEYTVAGAPAIRYEIAGSDGELLVGDGVIWVVGVQGQLPDFDEITVRNYLVIHTSSRDSGALEQHVDVLDRMVATLEIPAP